MAEKKSAKAGRNRVKCAQYKARHTQERNRARRVVRDRARKLTHDEAIWADKAVIRRAEERGLMPA